jgi:hypothetical protein
MLQPANPQRGEPLTGEPDAGEPPVRFGGRGSRGLSLPLSTLGAEVIVIRKTYKLQGTAEVVPSKSRPDTNHWPSVSVCGGFLSKGSVPTAMQNRLEQPYSGFRAVGTESSMERTEVISRGLPTCDVLLGGTSMPLG